MAAINMHALVARASSEMLAKRDNWASRNVGPMVVFCILGAVGMFGGARSRVVVVSASFASC
jgi:hypothetical protein